MNFSILKQKKIYKRKSKNQFIVLFLLFTVTGYTAFFSSKLWFPESKITKLYTPFDTVLTLDNHEFTLKNWVWSPTQSMMEIELDVTNRNFDNLNAYLFSCRDKRSNPITINKIITTKDLIVLHLVDVPEDFKELSLRIKIDYPDDRKDTLDMLRFYTNRNEVPIVDQIIPLSETEYYIARLDRSIQKYKSDQDLIYQKIADFQQKIVSAEADIASLKEKSVYESADDIKKTEKQIQDIEETITDFKNQISNLQEDVLMIDSNIQEAQEKLSSWKSQKKGDDQG